MTDQRFNFVVEEDGVVRARFRECAGLDNSQEAGEHREGVDRTLSARPARGSGAGTLSF